MYILMTSCGAEGRISRNPSWCAFSPRSSTSSLECGDAWGRRYERCLSRQEPGGLLSSSQTHAKATDVSRGRDMLEVPVGPVTDEAPTAGAFTLFPPRGVDGGTTSSTMAPSPCSGETWGVHLSLLRFLGSARETIMLPPSRTHDSPRAARSREGNRAEGKRHERSIRSINTPGVKLTRQPTPGKNQGRIARTCYTHWVGRGLRPGPISARRGKVYWGDGIRREVITAPGMGRV
ncbi:hypothetical protein VUR80DRAFT_1828 [Thermomyces stellatus]